MGFLKCLRRDKMGALFCEELLEMILGFHD